MEEEDVKTPEEVESDLTDREKEVEEFKGDRSTKKY
jgi:hypothetical protein